MTTPKDEIAKSAAETTLALNPLMGGINREELVGAVAMMLRSTMTNPVTTAKSASRIAKENASILMGKSKRKADPKDRRFRDPAWEHNPFYRRGMQAYLATQEHLNDWVSDLKMSELEHARAKFVMGMITDALAPTNTLIGNPAATKRVVDSGGLSLLKGLKNAYTDLTKNGGMPSQVDKRPFKVGENLAITEGQVIWKNEMLELIQYAPKTDKVHRTPILIIPPQINKYYAMDLSPMTSMVQFLLAMEQQTFVVSWRNPKREHRDWGMQEYIDSLIQASEVVRKVTKSKKINVSGACSGGITTATLASLLAAAGDDRINAITFMVCVLNPQKEDSELGQIVSDGSLEIARAYSKKKGILKGDDLARMFAWMRPNDLIWNYVVNNYLMGEDPAPFDVLYWNNDSTNLPAQLHSDYLDMGLNQPFDHPGEYEVAGHMLDMSKVKSDAFIVAGLTDHITPWKACYRTAGLLGSDNIEFILSSSGHIQSLLNPPGNPKAKMFRNPEIAPTADEWAAGATEEAGSWWPVWGEWLKARSGALKTAPKACGSDAFQPLYPAPGRYVFDE
ncbi:alpha/beta fold hydrolase [Hyphomonas sp.]|uniref:alpha/beta fold hydrolase n=1 Tax=Hyphomonas sp. TaxID=87 RepID=UPI000C3CA9A0|nr:alpha/beta fold hydrolase [Hyphomonas sp.]MAB11687.1 class II poly(R)-hydroxyalkanoic acid synthase [Hyphomonas sp.]MAU66756.1 class II poly(R)-hydroxyalkanoic acid synthase [Hyphomonas sp.]MBM58207.1 class II poly(R)-hydroxyalkanoic acid synthase [Hyphomonas sp.]